MEERKRKTELGPDGPLLDFTKYFFEPREGMNFIEGPHHALMCSVLDRVLNNELNRVIITLPPGYTKTEICVVNFMAKGFQKNPRSKFIHTTFSGPLANENSDKVRELLGLPDFKKVSDVVISKDTNAKDRWKTNYGGGLLAKSAGGPITGFRAGYMEKDEFTGALLVDDPLKPDDAFSPTKRKNVNQRATNTFRSRLAHEGVPIVVVQQRLHGDDFAGHLLTGGTGDYWHHLDLSVYTEPNREYPKEWTHGIPIPHDLPEGPLWEFKHSESQIEILKADSYTYASQYKQRPVSVEGALFDMTGLQFWSEWPGEPDYWMMFADTAQKTGERNDFSVLQLWAKFGNTGAFLFDQVRGKWEAPDLEKNARAFWAKHKSKGVRSLKIEDKVSGTGLIQSLRRKSIPVQPIQRNRDKYTRGLDTAPWISNGMVWLPEEAKFKTELLYEMQTFDGLGTGHDDQVDPLMDAVAEFYGGSVYDVLSAVAS